MTKYRLIRTILKFVPIKFLNFFLHFKNYLNFIISKNYHKPTREMKIQNIIKFSPKKELIIETGTYFALSTSYLSKHFKNVITIELSKDLYEFSKEKLKKYNNVQIINSESKDFLKQFFIDKSNLNVTFFLDAHFMGENSTFGEKSNPILDELEIILSNISKLNSFYIFIDDARTFMSSKTKYKEIKFFNSIFDLSKQYNLNFSVAVDMIIISNEEINL